MKLFIAIMLYKDADNRFRKITLFNVYLSLTEGRLAFRRIFELK
jgi:hypothetical protein